MDFILISSQFSFEEGEVLVVIPDPVFTPVGSARLRSNVIEYRGTLLPGPVLLSLTNSIVRSRMNESSRRVDAIMLRTLLSKDDVERAATEIRIGPHAIIRIHVVGGGVERGARPQVGFVGDPTLVQQVNDNGYVDVLLPIGRNKVYLGQQPSVKASFDIVEGQDDAGTVILEATP